MLTGQSNLDLFITGLQTETLTIISGSTSLMGLFIWLETSIMKTLKVTSSQYVLQLSEHDKHTQKNQRLKLTIHILVKTTNNLYVHVLNLAYIPRV